MNVAPSIREDFEDDVSPGGGGAGIIPPDALLNEDGTPLLNEDGTLLRNES